MNFVGFMMSAFLPRLLQKGGQALQPRVLIAKTLFEEKNEAKIYFCCKLFQFTRVTDNFEFNKEDNLASGQ